MSLTSQQLVDIFGPPVTITNLARWRSYGWLEFEPKNGGPGKHITYPDWTPKIIRLILNEQRPKRGNDYRHNDVSSQILKLTKEALVEDPDTRTLVIVSIASGFVSYPIKSTKEIMRLGKQAGVYHVVRIPED